MSSTFCTALSSGIYAVFLSLVFSATSIPPDASVRALGSLIEFVYEGTSDEVSHDPLFYTRSLIGGFIVAIK